MKLKNNTKSGKAVTHSEGQTVVWPDQEADLDITDREKSRLEKLGFEFAKKKAKTEK